LLAAGRSPDGCTTSEQDYHCWAAR